MIDLFADCYKNTRVLVTGHNGFKGSWLTFWLEKLGAQVVGFSLAPNTQPHHFSLLKPQLQCHSIIDDICRPNALYEVIQTYQPTIVFHLAAQPLVLESYLDPIYTYETNVLGTLRLFEACRISQSKQHPVKAIVNVTTDKCYENKENGKAYQETDELGGYDPYSSSKACSEILTSSFRRSFFNLADYKVKHQCLLASARAGNVIGGGDWAKYRLFPDIAQALNQDKILTIRNPSSTRPWQHVLEPLFGYLKLGQMLLEEKTAFAQAWNFGPSMQSNATVETVMSYVKELYPSLQVEISSQLSTEKFHEASLLQLDSTKAKTMMDWNQVWSYQEAIQKTLQWYQSYYLKNELLTEVQLHQFCSQINHD